jgi:hypothetical protein
VALSYVLPLSHVLPCFPIVMLSSLHLVIFRYPYLSHTKSDFRKFCCYEFNTSFSSHLPFRFPLKKKFLPSIFKKILWSNKSFKVPPCKNYFLWKSRWHFLLIDLGLRILTTQPSHFYTLAYCRPLHLISIEFQNIDNDQGNPPKKLFFPLQLL